MKKYTAHFIFFVIIVSIVICSCKKKIVPKCDGSTSTYNSNIKTIINITCTNSSCHPNYSTYAGIKSILNNGNFKNEVITKKSMPKGNSLTSDDLNKIQCWIDAGYPEN